MVSIVEGMTTVANAVQPLNALFPNEVRPSLITTEVNPVQPLKANCPMDTTL